MNYNTSLCTSKDNDRLTQTSVSTTTAEFSYDSVYEHKQSCEHFQDFFRQSIKKAAPLCTISLLGLLSIGSLTLGGDSFTENIDKTGESGVNAIEYNINPTIDIIRANISASGTLHNVAGIYSKYGLTIHEISTEGSISANADKNYAYAIRVLEGDISITNTINGSISATAKGQDAAGIYIEKEGDIIINGISETAKISAHATTYRAFGIYAKAGSITISSTIDGSIEALSDSVSKADTTMGIWANKGIISLHSIGQTGSITAEGKNGIRGMQAFTHITIENEIAGNISAIARGGATEYGNDTAIGINSNSNSNIDRGNISIGSISETGSINARTIKGIQAYGIQSAYGDVKIGNINGSIKTSSDLVQTEQSFSAAGILAYYQIQLKNIGATGEIIVNSKGKDAYAILSGFDGGSSKIYNLNNITIENIDGTISATAATGTAAAIYGNSVKIGDIGTTGSIQGVSTETADAFGIYAGYLLNTGKVNGTVSASTGGDVAIAMLGLGITTSLGATARLEATGGKSANNVYALFSGCYQGNKYTSYNVSDNISIAAGATIKGIIELGGSGTGYDHITLTGGTADKKGTFDFTIQRTLNTVQQSAETRFSHLALTVGEQNGQNAYWNFTTPNMSFEKILIHQSATLSSDRSLLADEATAIVNYGTLEGVYTLNIGANMSLTTGTLGIDSATGKLSIINTGLGSGISLTATEGASLGTSLINDTKSTWLISMENLEEQRASLYKQLLGEVDLSKYSFTYHLQGNILLNEGNPVTINPDDGFDLGTGSSITVEGELPDKGINLSGGTADVTKSGAILSDKQISGSAGTLVTTSEQEFVINQSQDLGYTVAGSADGLTAGAKVSIGTKTNTSPLELTLSGNIYSDKIDIKSGKVTLSTTGSLGTDKGTLKVSNNAESGQESILVNNGKILSEVTIENHATLQGAGLFMGTVTLNESQLIVGNSPGQMVYNANLNISDSSVRFTLDGTQKSILGTSSNGTYSNILMGNNSSITWGDHNTIILDIWGGLSNATTQTITVDLFNGATIDLSDTAIALAGEYKQLVDENSIIVNQDGSISFQLNRSYATDMLADDARNTANTMWSSANTLSAFTQATSAQMDAPRSTHSRHFWGMGIGDFINMKSFKSNTAGYAIGGDYQIGSAWTLGASFGNTYGTNTADDKLLKTDQDSVMMAIYGRYTKQLKEKQTLIFDAAFGGGSVDNTSTGSFLGTGGRTSSWTDNVFTANLRAKLSIEQKQGFTITPFIGLDFELVQQDDITVAHTQSDFNYSKGGMYRLSIPVGISIAKTYAINETQYLLPSLSIAYIGDVAREIPHLDRMVLDQQNRFYGDNPGNSAVRIDIGTQFIMNPQWSTRVFYNFEARSGLINHAVNASVNYSF